MVKAIIALGFVFLASFSMADTFETGWDRPGYDYYNYEMNNPRAILCQWACQKDNRCRAWTYVKPGVQGTLARCWLKDRVPAAKQNAYCTSGIVQQRLVNSSNGEKMKPSCLQARSFIFEWDRRENQLSNF